MSRLSEEPTEEIEDLVKEVEELERELRRVAERLLEARWSLPDQLEQALSSRLRSLRPVNSSVNLSGLPGTSAATVFVDRPVNEAIVGNPLTDADERVLEKLHTLRKKTTSNIAAMPLVLKRMNDCVERLDKLNQYNLNIHSVFSTKEKNESLIFHHNLNMCAEETEMI